MVHKGVPSNPSPAEGRGLGMKNWKKEVVCIMHACDRGGGIPVVCLSGGLLTPPSCLNQSLSNFQGMLGAILAAHIYEISPIGQYM